MDANLTSEERAQILQTIEMFEVIAQTQPDDCQSLDILKEAYVKIGQQDDAMRVARRLADAYLTNGLYSSALLECEQILTKQPDSPDVVALMGEIEARSGGSSAAPSTRTNGSEAKGSGPDSGLTAPRSTGGLTAPTPRGAAESAPQHQAATNALTKTRRVPGQTPSQPSVALPEEDGSEQFARYLVHHRIVPDKVAIAALTQMRNQPSPAYGARLRRLEQEWDARKQNEVAANLHSVYFQARFGGDEPVIKAQAAQFVELFRGRTRVCDLGSGRGTFLALMRDEGIGAYGVDLDRRMVEHATTAGFEVTEADGLSHLRSLAAASIDGVFARHIAEHVLPGALVEILRELRRVLRPGSPVVMITPNPATLSVGAHTFWLDPSHLRPIPPELFRFYLEVEGFTDVSLRTFAPTEERLDESVPAGPIRENARLLNRMLFGDRDYAVVGSTPSQ